MSPRHHQRGLTLIEITVYGLVFLLLAVCTLRALAEGRALRGRGRDRAALALYVSSELDRARATSSTLTGVHTLRPPSALGQTTATLEVTHTIPRLASLTVTASRTSVYGPNIVTMTTLVPAEETP